MNSRIADIPAPRKETALFIALGVFFLAAFYPALFELIGYWYTSDDQSYSFFIIPFSLYFGLKNKPQWIGVPVRTSLPGGIAFTLSIMIYLFGQIAEIDTLSSISLVFTIWSIIWFLFGMPIFRALVFPLGLLLLMIPIPAQIYSMTTVPLQLLVSKVSTGVTQLGSVPIYREGNVLILPNHTLAVVQACSGLRSLMALITLCVIFGYMTLKSNWLRTILVFGAIPVAVLANILRVIIMVVSFYYFDFDLVHGTWHTVFGIFIFSFALAAIMLLRRLLSRWDRADSTP